MSGFGPINGAGSSDLLTSNGNAPAGGALDTDAPLGRAAATQSNSAALVEPQAPYAATT